MLELPSAHALLESIVGVLRELELIRKAARFVLLLRFADDNNDSICLAKKGVVCLGEPEIRVIWHVADAPVISSKCAAKRLKRVRVGASIIGCLTRDCRQDNRSEEHNCA